jgi:hypothetical protein
MLDAPRAAGVDIRAGSSPSLAGSSAGRARALAALLTAALQHHETHGDGDCLVCGRPDALTGEWRQATEQEVAQLGGYRLALLRHWERHADRSARE